jgi:2-hydroxy-3-oxopropionate reductase
MIYGRTSTRLADLAEAGANIMSNPRELTAASDVVLVMLPDLPQIEEILTGDDGILAGVTERKTLVVGSSVSPAGLRALAARLTRQTRGLLRVVDAPVSGGVEGAAAATLSIMVGGAAEDVRVVWPILTTMGTPVHLGHLGSGQVAKACNQLIVAATMTTIAESAVIAKRAGLNVDSFLTVLRGGYAGSRVLETKQQKVVERDYRPAGAAGFMVKDLRAAHDEAVRTHTRTRQLDTLRDIFDDLVRAGVGDDDLAVVHRYVEQSSAQTTAGGPMTATETPLT